MSGAGKGDSPRPRQVSEQEYEARWLYMTGKMTLEELEQILQRIKDKKHGTI